MYFTDVVVPTELTLHPRANTTTPVPISIVDDEMPEEDEKFRVVVNFQGGGQGDLYATVIVVDDDRKLYYIHYAVISSKPTAFSPC